MEQLGNSKVPCRARRARRIDGLYAQYAIRCGYVCLSYYNTQVRGKMTRYWLVWILFGSLSWGQATSSQSTLAIERPGGPASDTPKATASDQPNTPVITINGLCDNPPTDKSGPPKCKTVITQAQFERLIDAVQPNMPTRGRREFALQFADALVMTKKAEQ